LSEKKKSPANDADKDKGGNAPAVKSIVFKIIVPVAIAFCGATAIMHGAQDAYDSHGKRNPFLPPSQPTPAEEKMAVSVDTAALEAWFSRNLGGILWDPVSPRALVGDEIVSRGDEVEGCKILDIKPGAITIDYEGKRFDVPMGTDQNEKSGDGH